MTIVVRPPKLKILARERGDRQWWEAKVSFKQRTLVRGKEPLGNQATVLVVYSGDPIHAVLFRQQIRAWGFEDVELCEVEYAKPKKGKRS